MDDPWGSPWTSTGHDDDDDSSVAPTQRAAATTLEPASHTTILPTVLQDHGSFPALATPWAENADEGFGDWTAATEAAEPFGDLSQDLAQQTVASPILDPFPPSIDPWRGELSSTKKDTTEGVLLDGGFSPRKDAIFDPIPSPVPSAASPRSPASPASPASLLSAASPGTDTASGVQSGHVGGEPKKTVTHDITTGDEVGSLAQVPDYTPENAASSERRDAPEEAPRLPETSKNDEINRNADVGITTLDAFIPDYVLDDSFTCMSERKTWYRVSRQGSLRWHRQGDDENYRPVAWQGSAVRSETLKIVRRWMEEDSLTGKPVLGGGGVKGNLFGWDSKAATVALDEVYRPRTKMGPSTHDHARNASVLSKTSTSADSSMLLSSPVSFSWSSGGGGTTSAASSLNEPRGFERERAAQQRKKPSSIAPPPNNTSTFTGFESGTSAAAMAEATNDDNGDDDDDDWGEMVSPTAANGRMAPTAGNKLQHPDGAQSSWMDEGMLVHDIVRGLPDLAYMSR